MVIFKFFPTKPKKHSRVLGAQLENNITRTHCKNTKFYQVCCLVKTS